MKSGQALVIVLLILAVAATLGLSVASRSVTEINLSTTQDDSSQALSAAESGIEAVLEDPTLPTGGVTPIVTGQPGSYSITSKTSFGNGTSSELSTNMSSGEYATLFLQQVDPDGTFTDLTPWGNSNITVCWGNDGLTGTSPSLEATLYYKANGVAMAKRTGYNGVSRSNGFTLVGGCTDTNYEYGATFNIVNAGAMQMTGTAPLIPYFIRFRMLYNADAGHPLKVTAASGNFPVQGQVVEVQGTAGETSRRVNVSQSYPLPPGILDNALFSGTNL